MKQGRPTSVTFLWHMHQPWYGDPESGRMILPWVRFHALKDYLDMIAVAEQFPQVHMTFNLVPSLLLQIQQYVAGETSDAAVDLGRIPAADVDLDGRRWLLENAFKCNWQRLVDPYPRFRELLELRGRNLAEHGLTAAARRLAERDVRDLQVWCQLAWCGREIKLTEPFVAELIQKGRDFSEDDKSTLLDLLDKVLATVIPRYLRAARNGHVELATTPFYHPILPLLCHYQDVRAALPGCRIPPGVHDIPEDAEHQLRGGREKFTNLLGFSPDGLWPSEGSISTAALELASEIGFKWAASDERVLARSIERQADPNQVTGRKPTAVDFLQPHRHAGLALFFRHQEASDRIGFQYSGWEAEPAVNDLIKLLERAAANGQQLERPVIPVILDGENCWEYYPENGYPFLKRLYEKLSDHPVLQPVTFTEHLALAPEPPQLEYLFPASWINNDFYIWAGHREDQRGWELLFATRRALVASESALDEETRRQAWEHLYIAEGSDWYWWFGDDHSSADDGTFDILFRGHLKRVYQLLGLEPPAGLSQPIAGLHAPSPLTPPVGQITPTLDGRETDFFEWRAAGRIEGRGPAGAMSRGGGEASFLRRVRYGFDQQNLYLAIELETPETATAEWVLTLRWAAEEQEAVLALPGPRDRAELRIAALTQPPGAVAEAAVDQLVELGIPLSALPIVAGETGQFSLTLVRDGEEVERWPAMGEYEFAVPSDADWMRNWLV